jgi:subtilisin family serine protease
VEKQRQCRICCRLIRMSGIPRAWRSGRRWSIRRRAGGSGRPTPATTIRSSIFSGASRRSMRTTGAKGRLGTKALVAVLDEGVDATHPDLAANVRADLSTSFAEDCNGAPESWQPDPGFYFNHGTHVAGAVAVSRLRPGGRHRPRRALSARCLAPQTDNYGCPLSEDCEDRVVGSVNYGCRFPRSRLRPP